MTDLNLCPEKWQRALTFYTVAMGAPISFLYVLLVVAFSRHVRAFHPLFAASFFLIITAYTVCAVMLSIRNLSEFFFDKNIMYELMEFVFTLSSFYIQPIVVLSLLERLGATVWVRTYENSRCWIAYIFGQIICVMTVGCLVHLQRAEQTMLKQVQFTLSLIISMCLITLLLINRRLTLASRARSTLTTRYQLTENVRALRIFVPFIVMDNLISVMFVVTKEFFNVGRTFVIEDCEQSSSYIPLFAVFRTIAMFVQALMPVVVAYKHGILRRPRCVARTNKSLDAVSVKKHLKIRNVLGMDVAGSDSPEDHFAQLRLQWGTKF